MANMKKSILLLLLSISLLSCTKESPIDDSINTYKIEVTSSAEHRVNVYIDGNGIYTLQPSSVKTSYQYTFKDIDVKVRSIHAVMSEVNRGGNIVVTIQLKVFRNGTLLSNVTGTNHVRYDGIY
jgi:hypothetical protein